jgi:hypothetical protein
MSTVTTIIERPDGVIISHTGETGITITGKRDGTSHGLDALIEVGNDIPSDELVATIGTFITFLEEQFGEQFVAKCFAHYASETQKQYIEEGNTKVFIVRGRTRK